MTVLVGIAVEGKPVAGVIHQPFYGSAAGLPARQQGRTVWGMLGIGVRGIEQQPSPSHGGLRLAVSRSHYAGTVERVTENLQAKETVRTPFTPHTPDTHTRMCTNMYTHTHKHAQKTDTTTTNREVFRH